MSPEQLNEYIDLRLKTLLREKLTIEVNPNKLFGTLDVSVSLDGEEISVASIWGSDIQHLIS